MRNKLFLLMIALMAVILAGCTPSSQTASPTAELAKPQPTAELGVPTDADPSPSSEEEPQNGSAELTQEDAQGAVTVTVTPLNLGQPAETLDFEVVMNTHSVELSMDLAQLATLSNDLGQSVTPSLWDAPMGGHHVSGTLSFPASADGTSILAGATNLTLTIRDVDTPERNFTWQLSP